METLKIDFGSGHNKKESFASCDFTNNPFLDFHYDAGKNEITECFPNSVDIFNLKNVIHHLPDMEKVLSCLKKYLKNNGKIIIIESTKESYLENKILDILWYRYVIPRYDIWISLKYRDYKPILVKLGFKLLNQKIKNHQEISCWQKQ